MRVCDLEKVVQLLAANHCLNFKTKNFEINFEKTSEKGQMTATETMNSIRSQRRTKKEGESDWTE